MTQKCFKEKSTVNKENECWSGYNRKRINMRWASISEEYTGDRIKYKFRTEMTYPK